MPGLLDRNCNIYPVYPGHTQMEFDSMHSAVEYDKKKAVVYIPGQWCTMINMAHRSRPYLIVPLEHIQRHIQADSKKHER